MVKPFFITLISMPSKSARKKSGWKDIQSKAKTKRRNKLALTVLVLIVILLIVSSLVQFGRSLFSPWKRIDSSRSYVWNGEFNINLVIRASSISLLSYNPKEEKITIINIPDETYLEAPGGFGSWQLRSIYGLGGDKLLKDSLTSFLGAPIDGILDFGPPFNQKDAIALLDILRKNPLSGFNLLSKLKTDLTLWELVKLKLALSSVRFDKIKQLDLDKLNVLDKSMMNDGTPVFIADPVKLDSILTDLADPTIVSEHKSIAVFNGTTKGQLAQKWARLITNLGGNVIITSNTSNIKKTAVYGEKSQTLKRLRQILNLDCQNNQKCDKLVPESEELESSRAQINLLLGEDALK